MYLNAEKKKEIFSKHGGSDTNTGSAEGQIALFSYRIAHLTEHLKKNRKDEIEIETADIDSAELYAKEGEGLTGLAIAAIIVGAFLVALLIIGLIAAAVNSSDEDNSSSDSNSNSNSNSGDSGSGASSDGSNSSSDGSGCYVATMVYGSYEAPKVLILRAFRDRFLQRFKWGRSFIHWYYAKSPAFVEQHQGKPLLRKAIKSALDVFVFLITPIYRK